MIASENGHASFLWSERPAPRLVHELDASVLRTVSRRQRLVLLLIDGRRSLLDLCHLLHLPQYEVEGILDELEQRELLTSSPQPDQETQTRRR